MYIYIYYTCVRDCRMYVRSEILRRHVRKSARSSGIGWNLGETPTMRFTKQMQRSVVQ